MVDRQLRAMGINLTQQRQVVLPEDDDVRRPTGRPAPARPGWEAFLVASKPVGEPWPMSSRQAISKAREAYEAGTHEMVSCTTPEGWTQLYLRPRQRPTTTRPYFTPEPL